MSNIVLRITPSALLTALVVSARVASAAPPTREECIETHGRAQDARDKAQLADAKRLFLVCAQQSCPALVQSDCAKFGEELSRSVPSVSFSLRDAHGSDIPDAQVFVDGTLLASRLDDGKAHDIDPGKHAVKFVRGPKETTISVVIAVGEKGRNITATLADTNGGTEPEAEAAKHTKAKAGPARPILPLVVAGVGGVALVGGAVLGAVGLGSVPDQCTTSPRECTAPPGDPVFDDAKSAVGLANVGLGLAIGGLIATAGGLVWYFTSRPSAPSPTSAKLVPFTNGQSSGAAVHLTF